NHLIVLSNICQSIHQFRHTIRIVPLATSPVTIAQSQILNMRKTKLLVVMLTTCLFHYAAAVGCWGCLSFRRNAQRPGSSGQTARRHNGRNSDHDGHVMDRHHYTTDDSRPSTSTDVLDGYRLRQENEETARRPSSATPSSSMVHAPDTVTYSDDAVSWYQNHESQLLLRSIRLYFQVLEDRVGNSRFQRVYLWELEIGNKILEEWGVAMEQLDPNSHFSLPDTMEDIVTMLNYMMPFMELDQAACLKNLILVILQDIASLNDNNYETDDRDIMLSPCAEGLPPHMAQSRFRTIARKILDAYDEITIMLPLVTTASFIGGQLGPELVKLHYIRDKILFCESEDTIPRDMKVAIRALRELRIKLVKEGIKQGQFLRLGRLGNKIRGMIEWLEAYKNEYPSWEDPTSWEEFCATDSNVVVDRRAPSPPECPICLDITLQSEEPVKSLPCGHKFHTKCIAHWLETNNTCPVCRGIARN
ncbi:hypothetical protein SeMB42_g07792, partial [Synchytrium endobioticum]